MIDQQFFASHFIQERQQNDWMRDQNTDKDFLKKKMLHAHRRQLNRIKSLDHFFSFFKEKKEAMSYKNTKTDHSKAELKKEIPYKEHDKKRKELRNIRHYDPVLRAALKKDWDAQRCKNVFQAFKRNAVLQKEMLRSWKNSLGSWRIRPKAFSLISSIIIS